MNGYEFLLKFANEHPFLTFCALVVLYELGHTPFKIVNRYFRTRNIREKGWPPAHLDADGDFREL